MPNSQSAFFLSGSMKTKYGVRYGHADMAAAPSSTNFAGTGAVFAWGQNGGIASVTEGATADFNNQADNGPTFGTVSASAKHGLRNRHLGSYESFLAHKHLTGSLPTKLIVTFFGAINAAGIAGNKFIGITNGAGSPFCLSDGGGNFSVAGIAGPALDTKFHLHKFEIEVGGNATWYMDGALIGSVATSLSNDNWPCLFQFSADATVNTTSVAWYTWRYE